MGEEFELRMYVLVLYQLKPIQQGIQAQHAITEYAEKYFSHPLYRQWATKNKTTIILSAGGSKELMGAITQLSANNIDNVFFVEEDLYDMPTAVCFLVDERVWNREKYPDLIQSNMEWIRPNDPSSYSYNDFCNNIGGDKNLFLRSYLPKFKLA